MQLFFGTLFYLGCRKSRKRKRPHYVKPVSVPVASLISKSCHRDIEFVSASENRVSDFYSGTGNGSFEMRSHSNRLSFPLDSNFVGRWEPYSG